MTLGLILLDEDLRVAAGRDAVDRTGMRGVVSVELPPNRFDLREV
jgi:hypothetical protein